MTDWQITGAPVLGVINNSSDIFERYRLSLSWCRDSVASRIYSRGRLSWSKHRHIDDASRPENALERVACDRPDPFGIKTASWENSWNSIRNRSRGWRLGRNSKTRSSQMLPGPLGNQNGREMEDGLISQFWVGCGALEGKIKTNAPQWWPGLGINRPTWDVEGGFVSQIWFWGAPWGKHKRKRSLSEGNRSVLGITRTIYGKWV